MATDRSPALVLLAGPNGAGKTTLYETRVAPRLAVPFINADLIQHDELKDSDIAAAYKAAEIAAQRREEFLQKRKSFATETVFSHPSKLDLIKKARRLGYRVILFHISVGSADLCAARVFERVKEDGHAVPEEKIRARYDRNGPIIRDGALISDIALIFDNSQLNQPPSHIMTLTNGKPSFVVARLPDWALNIYEADLEI